MYLNFLPCSLISISGFLAQSMHATMDIGVVIFVIIGNGINDWTGVCEVAALSK